MKYSLLNELKIRRRSVEGYSSWPGAGRISIGIRELLCLYLVLVGSPCSVVLGENHKNVDDDAEIVEASVSMTAVAGGKVLLPCNITPPTPDDEVALILWYKDESTSPLYSVDARRGSIHRAHHVIGDLLSRRAYLDTVEFPAVLQVEDLAEKDEGIYRCRVDFRKARTRNSDIVLSIIVPPKKPIITDQNGEILQSLIGPYNEGDRLLLVCEAEGGKPAPNITWWRESVLLDNTYETTPHGVVRNELIISELRRHDLMAVLTCLASNNNISVPSSSAVTVDMNFRPVEVRIENSHQAMSARKPTDLVCKAKGSRPPAILTWWKGSTKMKRTKDRISIDGYVTTSTLTFTPSNEDSGKYLSCRAENPLILGSAVEDGWKLEVHYVPQLNLRLGSKLNHDHIQEYNDVFFECNIRANPWVNEIGWRFEGREILTNLSYGVIVSNQSLVLQKVRKAHRGYYTCTATNSEGQGESNPVYLRVQYAPTCKLGQKTVYGVARHESVKVFCEVESDPPLTTFRWDFNNSVETLDVVTYVSEESQSVATYIPRSETDYGTLLCWAKNAVGLQQEPCVYSIIPAGPPDPPGNCSFTNKTESSLVIDCAEGYDGGLPQFFVMEVHESGQHHVRANVTTDIPTLSVHGLPAGSSFVLVVYSANIKGRSQTILLRASTMPAPVRQTQREAMWQFNMSPILMVLIGVVLVLVLLAVVVVAGMKQKSRRTKKSAEALTYDDLKKQPNLPKDCFDKIFAYSTAEEKCPDLIPDREFYVRGYESNSQCVPMDHEINPTTMELQSPELGRDQLWTRNFSAPHDNSHVPLNRVCYSRQAPETVNLCSMKIPEYYSSVDAAEMSRRSPPHFVHPQPSGESINSSSSFQPPFSASASSTNARQGESAFLVGTIQRTTPLSIMLTSPNREDNNMQTEV